jgi:aryl-alcohol dehydrogenase-like predicted oxidoreductase
MGIIGMKVPARGRLFRDGGVSNMREALGYALSCPISTVIVGCDSSTQLEENVRLAAAFRQMSLDEMTRLERATEGYAADAAYFKRGGAGAETN